MVARRRRRADLQSRRAIVDYPDMNSPIAVRISIQLFVAAGFLAVFGALNSSQYGTSLVPSLLLAAVCVGAGFAVRTGTPNGRLIGLVASGGTVAYGVISLFGQHYLPGSVVAMFALVRLATSGAAFGSGPSTGAVPIPGAQYPPATYPQAQYPQAQYPQAQYPHAPYGQPAYGQPQPGPAFGQPAYGQPPAPPASTPPSAGDPRFG
jgi:hypothetical protein